VATRSKTSVFDSSNPAIAGSNTVGGMDMSLVRLACCQEQDSAFG
jgi:hypothetical protein